MALLKLVAANDVIGAQLAVIEALAGRQALYITPAEANGLMPEVHGLPDEAPESIAFIVESSGSTGSPKRISHTAEAALESANLAAARLGGHGGRRGGSRRSRRAALGAASALGQHLLQPVADRGDLGVMPAPRGVAIATQDDATLHRPLVPDHLAHVLQCLLDRPA